MHAHPLLLAAGHSRRFGTAKLLQPLPDGTPLALAAARNLAAGAGPIVAVVNPADHALQDLFKRHAITWIPCAAAADGMGHSLARGVQATADADGWLIALADMPLIQPATIAAVRDALLAGAPLAAPVYQQKRGHPVGFASRFRDQLSALRGDNGARVLLHRYTAELHRVPCNDSGILVDIDTPDDLRRLAC